MIERWFDPRGAIQRSRFVSDTVVTWLIGNLGVIAFSVATTSPFSFAGLGVLLDDRGQALGGISQLAGVPWAALTLALWGAQAWALAALSCKRLHDFGQSGWLAILSFIPGVQVVFWIALCLWPSERAVRVQPA